MSDDGHVFVAPLSKDFAMQLTREPRRSRMSALLVLVLAWCTAPASAAPNILFIMSDDHASHALSCYGSKINRTPNLDRLAKEGMRFENAFCTNSLCGPARAVILTGKYSHRNGYAINEGVFDGSQPTVAKLLQKAGYQTAVIGKWHLGSQPTGFDYYHVLIGQGPYYNPPMHTNEPAPGNAAKGTVDAKTGYRTVRHEGYVTDIITDLTLDWLKQKRDKTKPFFLMYHHKAPHREWQPGPKQFALFKDQKVPEPETLFDDNAGRGAAAKTQQMTVKNDLNRLDLKLDPPRNLTPAQLAAWHAAYDAENKAFEEAKLTGDDLVRWKYQRYIKDYLRCIASVDENVGRVLDYLDESGLAKDTIVIYTSDQGFYLGDHGWFDKRFMYDLSLRSPLLVRYPGHVAAGSVNKDLTLNLDFAETFLDYAGIKVPDDMQGRSLRPLLEGRTPADWRQSIYYHYYEYPGPHMVHRHYGVRTARHKLLYFYHLKEWELYDLEKDPREMRNVYSDATYAGTVKELRAELDRLRGQFGVPDDPPPAKKAKKPATKKQPARTVAAS
jgi:arylsulfatase A-like enzyme